MRCEIHVQEAVSKCTWCGAPVCNACLEAARGHKLCDRCLQRLTKEKVLPERRRQLRGDLSRNVDPALTTERIEEGKKMLEQKDGKKRELPRIRNVPDW